MALVKGTMPLIVAMSMESELVTQFLPSSLTCWSDVVYFDLIPLTEHQITPPTLALLLMKQQSQCSSHCWVVFQPLAPVQEVPVIWACTTFHFHMPPDYRRIMPLQVIIFRGCKDAVLAFALFPVSVPNPLPVFVRVSAGCPRP